MDKQRTKCEQIPKINNKFWSPAHKRWKVTLSDGQRINYSNYLMWLEIGKQPKEPFLVHHINGDKSDDRIENLKLLTKKEHIIIHNKGNDYGKYPKTEEHKRKISESNTYFKNDFLFEKFLENPKISQRDFSKLIGYKSHGFLSNRFGSWSIFKDLAIKHNKRTPCQNMTRVVGYIRPVEQMNEGKVEEVKDREMFDVEMKGGNN